MKHQPAVAACAGLVVLLLAGCGTTVQEAMRCEPPELTRFLPHHQLLVRQPPDFPFHYLWQTQGVYRRDYGYIYVAPVNTNFLQKGQWWTPDSPEEARRMRDNLAFLGDYMRRSFVTELRQAESRGGFRVVNGPGSRTVTLELALTQAVPTEAELNFVGTAANLLLPGVSLLTRIIATGTVSMEARIVDSRTRRLLFMAADRENDPAALLALTAYSYYGSTEYNIDNWAKQLAALSVSRRVGEVKHDAPLHWIAY